MSRPWILQLGPLTIPTDARDELNEIHSKRSPEQYINNIWADRYPNGNPARKSPDRIWPLKFGASAEQQDLSNKVVGMKRS